MGHRTWGGASLALAVHVLTKLLPNQSAKGI